MSKGEDTDVRIDPVLGQGASLDPDLSVQEAGDTPGLEGDGSLLWELLESPPELFLRGEVPPRRGPRAWWRRRAETRRRRRRDAREGPPIDPSEEAEEEGSASPGRRSEGPGSAQESDGQAEPEDVGPTATGPRPRTEGGDLDRTPSGPGEEAAGRVDPSAMEPVEEGLRRDAPPGRRRRLPWRRRHRVTDGAEDRPPDLLEELLTEGEASAPAASEGPSGAQGRHLAGADEGGPEGRGPAAAGPLERYALGSASGPRRAARERRRMRVRRRVLALLAAVVVGGAAAGLAVVVDDGDRRSGPGVGGVEPTTASGDVTTLLVVGTRTRSGQTGPRVIWLSLLAWDKGGGRGAVVSIPAHTATEVPGRGLLGLGQSLTSGGMPLLLVSTETLLGVPIDHYLELSMEDAGRLFDAVDPLSVDVPGEVRVGAGRNQARVVVPSGPQLLAAEHLVPLLFTVGMDGDDVELGTRQLAFWEGLLEKFRDDPQALTEGLRAASPALEASNLERPELTAFLTALVELPAEERTLATLPAEQVSVGGDQLYQVDEAEVRDFIQETVGVTDLSDDEVRVQILNGNGVPGIGQEVAGRLVGEGFRVILSGNARTLNHQRTRIVSYDPTPTGVAMARRARSLLGTGQVLVSSQGQGIVDLTIVVGEDFPRKS